MEICNLLFVPAKNTLIPSIVNEGDLTAANGLSYTTQQASMLIGLTGSAAIISAFGALLRWVIGLEVPGLSAFLAMAPDLAGPQGGIVLDFFSFLVSALLISRIRVAAMARHERAFDLHLIGRDVVEAFGVLRERRELRGFLGTIGLAILGGGAIIPVGLVYVQQNLVGDVPFLDMVPPLQRLATQSSGTFMLVFMALGMFAGALVVPRIARRFTLEQLFVAGVAGFGLAMLGFSTTGLYWVAAVFAMAAGFLLAEVTVAGNTYIAETVEDGVRGRVFAALESVLRVALLASMVLTAPTGDIVGGFVRRFFEASRLEPEEIVLTGSRITLMFASLIVLVAAVYAMRAIAWRRPKNGEVAVDA
jgi:dTMP kinase